jgi:hypothetical protein
MRTHPSDLHHRLMINFRGEEGLDYGGVSREWFLKLSREIANPNYGLFRFVTEQHTSVDINPESFVNPGHLNYFRFIGRVIGLALIHDRFLDVDFSLAFYKRLLNRPLTIKDLEKVDPEYCKNLLWLLENPVDDAGLELTFSVDYTVLGESKSYDLMPDGASLPVTDANKREYVEQVVKFRLTHGTDEQFKAIMKGLSEVIPVAVLSAFDERELEVRETPSIHTVMQRHEHTRAHTLMRTDALCLGLCLGLSVSHTHTHTHHHTHNLPRICTY